MDKPTEGTVVIANQNIEKLSPSQIATFRREKLGFVFQDFNLIETFSVKDNILLPLVLSGVDIYTFDSKLDYVSEKLDIKDILSKNITELSGGQKQRVAIARSLITFPKLILADEPTGQLDSKSAENVMQIFSSINDDGNTILMVTHSIKSASYAKKGAIYKRWYHFSRNLQRSTN
ncbi:ABC transporter ATP-binding protein [Criibacterium bergeronii]|uniref:ABC transporter ATP-binding protein n=1 Tax=Criibacterium bergeronii TaxID=1871336 RepID=UPI001FA9AD16|nr:ABC transporter ATP-binding protein [Criibacterium bergeronii]